MSEDPKKEGCSSEAPKAEEASKAGSACSFGCGGDGEKKSSCPCKNVILLLFVAVALIFAFQKFQLSREYQKAQKLFEEEKYEEAEIAFQGLHKSKPEDEVVKNYLAKCYLRMADKLDNMASPKYLDLVKSAAEMDLSELTEQQKKLIGIIEVKIEPVADTAKPETKTE